MPKRAKTLTGAAADDANASGLHLSFRRTWGGVVTDNRCKLTEEFVFWPSRQWRFDFAHPESRVAIEIDGGVHSGGRHVRGDGFEKDCEKLNAAAAGQWLVFRVTGRQISRHPVQTVELVWLTICHRMGWNYAGGTVQDAGRLAGGPKPGSRRK